MSRNETLQTTVKNPQGQDAAAVHYHIQWSSERLDWQRFNRCAEAEECAKELVLSDENYTIEKFDENCPRCGATRASE